MVKGKVLNTVAATYKVSADPHYMSLQAASDYIGVSIKTLRRQIGEGRLPGYVWSEARNAPILIRVADLEGLLKPIPTTAMTGGVRS